MDRELPRPPGPPPRASARLRTEADLLGFTPPPVTLRLKLLPGPTQWSLYLQPQTDARVSVLIDWLEAWCPMRVEFGSRNVLRADFDPVPAAWLERFSSLELEMAILYPNGTAIATVVGPHAALAAFARVISRSATPIDVQEVHAATRDAPLLTAPQEEALRAAFEAGYYRIPRPLNLHTLATRLGVSPASLSERLRRAEGRVIGRYVQQGATTPWDARTIFDAQDPAPRPEEDGFPDQVSS